MLFLPADIARLVLDYLGSEGYERSCETFLLECNHVAAITDYIHQNDADIKDLLPLTDKSLTTILHEYSVNSLALKKQKKHRRKTSIDNSEIADTCALNALQAIQTTKSQNISSLRRLKLLRIQQENNLKKCTSKQQGPAIVPLNVTKTYADIPQGAIVVDPPENHCGRDQGSHSTSDHKKNSVTANTVKSAQCLATSSSQAMNRIVRDPSDYCHTREINFLPNGNKSSKHTKLANHHTKFAGRGEQTTNQHSIPMTNQCSEPPATVQTPMDYDSGLTSSADEQLNKEQPIEKRMEFDPKEDDKTDETSKNDIPKYSDKLLLEKGKDSKVKTGDDPNFSIADDDIKEFPILLEKLLSDSYLQQKLAENINKALPSENNQPSVSTPLKPSDTPEVESRKIFTDSFLDAHISEDTIQDIVDMTTIDPAFEGLFNLFNVSKHDFLQENIQQRDKFTSGVETPTFEERMEQNPSPTKPFLFNECSNSAMIPNSPERTPTNSIVDKPRSEDSTDLPDNTGHRRKSRKPSKKDVLEMSSIVMVTSATAKKPDTCARTSPYTRKTTLSKTLESMPFEKTHVATAKTSTSTNSSLCESVCISSEQKDNSDSPQLSAMAHLIETELEKSGEAKEVSEPSNEMNSLASSLHNIHTMGTVTKAVNITDIVANVGEIGIKTSSRSDFSLKCFETFPEFSPLSKLVNANSLDSILNQDGNEMLAVSSGFSKCTNNNDVSELQSSVNSTSNSNPTEVVKEQNPHKTELGSDLPSEELASATSVSKAASILACAMQESRSPIKPHQKERSKMRRSPIKSRQLTQDVTSSQEDNSSNQTAVSSTSGCNYEVTQSEEIKTAHVQLSGYSNEFVKEVEPVQSSSYELKPRTAETEMELIQSNVSNYELKSATVETETELIPIQNTNVSNYEFKPATVKTEMETIYSNVSILKPAETETELTPIQDTNVSNYELKPVPVETETDLIPTQDTNVSNYELKPATAETLTEMVPYINNTARVRICHKSEPSQVVYSGPMEVLDGNNSVIRPKVVNNTPSTTVINLNDYKNKKQAPRQRPILPAGTHQVFNNQVINIPCFIDPLLIGTTGQFSAPIPVTYVSQDGNSDSLDGTNIFEKLSNLPIIPLCQTVNTDTSQVTQFVPPSQPKNGNINVLSNLQNANLTQPSIISSNGNINNNKMLSCQVGSKPAKKSNRGKRRIKPIPVSSTESPQNKAFTSAVEFPGACVENTKKLQTIDLMDLQAIQTISPHKFINIQQTPVKVVVRRSADGVTSLEEITTDISQSSAQTPPQVSQGSASEGRVRLRKQDFSDQSHVRILDFDEKFTSCKPEEKSTKEGKSTKKSQTQKPTKKMKKSPPKEKTDLVDKPEVIEGNTPRKLGEDLPLKKRPLPDSTCELIYETPTKLNPEIEKISPKIKTNVRRSPRRKTTTKNSKSPSKKAKSPSEKSKALSEKSKVPSEKSKSPKVKLKSAREKSEPEEKKTKTKSPRKTKMSANQNNSPKTQKNLKNSLVVKLKIGNRSSLKKAKIQKSPHKNERKGSPDKIEKKLKSSLKQCENVQEMKHVSFGEIDCITLNSPDVSHNIDQEVNEAAQWLIDMASSSPSKYTQVTGAQVATAAETGMTPGIQTFENMIPEPQKSGNMTSDIQTSPRKSPRKQMANDVGATEEKIDRKRKRESRTDKSKKSTKKRKGFPKDVDVDKFLSRLQYCS